MAKQIRSKKGLLKAYSEHSSEVQKYFEHMPKLIEHFPLDVCLAYSFSRLELGQNMALYCGAVRVHRADTGLARNAVHAHHLTRQEFKDLYGTVFGFQLPPAATSALKTAEDTRDAVMHGKDTSEDRRRNAIARVLEYAEALNKQLDRNCGFKAFGNLKGFAGRSKKLDPRTTRFMLKGMGFNLK